MKTAQEIVSKAFTIATIARKYKYKHWVNYEGLTVEAIEKNPSFPDMSETNYQIQLTKDDFGIALEVPATEVMETILMASMIFKAVMGKLDDEPLTLSSKGKIDIPSILGFCHLKDNFKRLLFVAIA